MLGLVACSAETPQGGSAGRLESEPLIQAAATSNPLPVKIANTATDWAAVPPVPVAGAVTINGTPTVSATINGTPSVNATISGTPSVNIAGTPSVNATIDGTPNVIATIAGTPMVTAQIAGTPTVALSAGSSVAVSNLPPVTMSPGSSIAVNALPSATHLGVKPSQFVQLKMYGGTPDDKFFNATTSEDDRSPFRVPAGKVLVITDFAVLLEHAFLANTSFRLDFIEWWNPDPQSITGRLRYQGRAPTDAEANGAVDFHLTSGIVIPADRGLKFEPSFSGVTATAYGYLTDAQ